MELVVPGSVPDVPVPEPGVAIVALGVAALGVGALVGAGLSAGAGAVESALEGGVVGELGAVDSDGALGSLAMSLVFDADFVRAAGFFVLAFGAAGSSVSAAVAGAGAAAGEEPASATTLEVSCEALAVLSWLAGTEAFDATRLEVGSAAWGFEATS